MTAIKSIEVKAKAYDEAIEALRSLFAEQAIKHCDRVNIKDITPFPIPWKVIAQIPPTGVTIKNTETTLRTSIIS